MKAHRSRLSAEGLGSFGSVEYPLRVVIPILKTFSWFVKSWNCTRAWGKGTTGDGIGVGVILRQHKVSCVMC